MLVPHSVWLIRSFCGQPSSVHQRKTKCPQRHKSFLRFILIILRSVAEHLHMGKGNGVTVEVSIEALAQSVLLKPQLQNEN